MWVDPSEGIYILDLTLNILQRYDLETLTYIESLQMPVVSPMSFAKLPGMDRYIYYKPAFNKGLPNDSTNQLYIADSKGKVYTEYMPASPKGKVLHGDVRNFYVIDDMLRFYPHFSNQIWNIGSDTLDVAYELTFGSNTMPADELFDKYVSSGEIMREVMNEKNGWIRMIYVYETYSQILVKYYIGKDFYVAGYDKKSQKSFNFKAEDVIDDVGLGGSFPLPIGVSQDKFVGILQPYEIDTALIKDPRLKELTQVISEEDNPILCIYTMQI